MFKKQEQKKESSKPKEKKKIEMMKDIYVETRSQALMEAHKKKLKRFDFESGLKQEEIY
jgi:hypothetical protein